MCMRVWVTISVTSLDDEADRPFPDTSALAKLRSFTIQPALLRKLSALKLWSVPAMCA